MSYDSIKNELSAKRRESLDLVRKIREFDETIDQVVKSQVEYSEKITREIESTKREHQKQFISSKTRELEINYANLTDTINSLKQNYNKDLSMCDEDSIYEELKKNRVYSDLESTMDEIKTTVSSYNGERFCSEFVDQLGETEVQITEKDLPKIFGRFSEIKNRVDKLSKKRSFDLGDKISTTIDNLVRAKVEDSRKGLLVFAGVGILLLILASWIAFPVYVLVLSTVMVINMRRGLVYSSAMRDCKVVSGNLDRIDNLLREKAIKSKESLIEELTAEYENTLEDLTRQEEDLRQRIIDTRKSAEAEFKFDDSIVIKKYDYIVSDLSNKLNQAQSEKKKCKERQDSLDKDILDLSERLKESVKSLTMEYLNFDKVGDSFEYDPVFLVDIKNDKPVMFEHSKSSSVFLYEDIMIAINFTRLLIGQLRRKINPFNMRITVWETEYMGTHFTQFYKEKTHMFNVVTNKDGINESLDEMIDQSSKKRELIMKEYKDIDEYNREMLELESVPEMYDFLFIIGMEESLLQSEKFRQLLLVGPPVGIYPFLFIHTQNINKDYVQIIKRVSKIYGLDENEITRKHPTWVMETLAKFDN